MQYPTIKVLSPTVALLAEIDLYTSLRYKRSWQGIGDWELHCVGTYDVLKPGNLIMLGNNGHKVGIIRAVQISASPNGVTTVASGVSLDGYVSQRIVLPDDNPASGGYFCYPKPTDTLSPVAAETVLKAYVSSQRPICAVAPDQHRGSKTAWMSRYEQLDGVLQEISEYTDVGWEIYLDLTRKRCIFEVIPGVDRSAKQTIQSRVIMSAEFESVDNVQYNIDLASHKNVAYAGGTGEGYDRTVIAVTSEAAMPQDTSPERYEVFLDCGSLELTETDESLSLQDEGRHKLLDYKLTECLTATISQSSTYIYGQDWDLGDLVTVADRSIGLQQDMRVAEVEECYEPDTMQLNVTFGTAAAHIGRVIRALTPQTR